MRVAAFVVVALLAGCGQKGPLTLPEKHPESVVTRPTQTPAEKPPEDAKKKTDEQKDETKKQP